MVLTTAGDGREQRGETARPFPGRAVPVVLGPTERGLPGGLRASFPHIVPENSITNFRPFDNYFSTGTARAAPGFCGQVPLSAPGARNPAHFTVPAMMFGTGKEGPPIALLPIFPSLILRPAR